MKFTVDQAEWLVACVLSEVLKVVASKTGCSPNEIDGLECVSFEQAIFRGLQDFENGDRPTPVRGLPPWRDTPKGTFKRF